MEKWKLIWIVVAGATALILWLQRKRRIKQTPKDIKDIVEKFQELKQAEQDSASETIAATPGKDLHAHNRRK